MTRPAAARVTALLVMELRTLLRDRRTVVRSILLPLAVTPVMLSASHWLEVRRQHTLEARDSRYAVVGPRADEVRELVARVPEVPREDDEAATAPLRIHEVANVADAAGALAEGSLDFYVEGASYADAKAAAESRRSLDTAKSTRGAADRGHGRADEQEQVLDVDDPGRVPPPDLLTASIVFRSDRDTSRRPAETLAARLRIVRQQQRRTDLSASGFVRPAATVVAVDTENLAGAAQVAGLTLGRIVTLLLLFFLLSGGAIVAQDTLAGEKERGTLETLLTTAISRREIVWAKVLLVLLVAVTITLIQVVNLLVYVGFGVIPASANLTAAITPVLCLGLLLFLLPLAALAAGVLVLVSGYARSYREAQIYFLPILLLGAVPTLAAFLPEVSLRSAIALVPVANISVGVKELMIGRVDWPALLVAWAVTAGAAGYVIGSATRVLSTERLIVPTAGERRPAGRPGAEVRPGQVAMWFAVMWACVMIISLNAGSDFDLRGQVFVNLVVIFLGGSALFIRRYRLDPRRVLSLRAPHPAAWIAVVAGIPSGLFTGIGVFHLSQLIVPVPRELLENFRQYVVPDNVPLWQLVPMISVLPGICEEIAFRGVFLHTLRRHYSGPAAVLLVGVAFGFFHFSLFRILQTAYLGVLLGAATVLTGSIYPAMVWHAGTNGLALALDHFQIDLGSSEPMTFVASAAVLMVCFWVLWRTGGHRDERP